MSGFAPLLVFLVGLLMFALRSAFRVAEHLLEDEIRARLPHAALETLKEAVAELPHELRAIRHQEWMAELASLSGQSLRAWRFARQCLRAARLEAIETRAELVGYTVGDGGLTRYLVGSTVGQRMFRRRLAQALTEHARREPDPITRMQLLQAARELRTSLEAGFWNEWTPLLLAVIVIVAWAFKSFFDYFSAAMP